MMYDSYCGVTIVRGGPIFGALMCNLERIYKHLKLSQTSYQQNYVPINQEKFGYQLTLIPTNKNDSTVYHINRLISLLSMHNSVTPCFISLNHFFLFQNDEYIIQ